VRGDSQSADETNNCTDRAMNPFTPKTNHLGDVVSDEPLTKEQLGGDPKLQVRCAWCEPKQSVNAEERNRITHGICEKHAAEARQELEAS
jgi:hypothetical protein